MAFLTASDHLELLTFNMVEPVLAEVGSPHSYLYSKEIYNVASK